MLMFMLALLTIIKIQNWPVSINKYMNKENVVYTMKYTIQ
jgi:hypothetical protein